MAFKNDRQRKRVMAGLSDKKVSRPKKVKTEPKSGRWSVVMDGDETVCDSFQEAKNVLADFSDTGFVSLGKKKKDGSYTVKVPNQYGDSGVATLILQPYEE